MPSPAELLYRDGPGVKGQCALGLKCRLQVEICVVSRDDMPPNPPRRVTSQITRRTIPCDAAEKESYGKVAMVILKYTASGKWTSTLKIGCWSG